MYNDVAAVIEYCHNMLKASEDAKAYLKARHITKDIVIEFNLGFVPQNCPTFLQRFRERIIFPISDPCGRYVGWTARTIGNLEPKYLNTQDSPIFKKGRLLYNYDKAKPIVQDKGWVVLVEGQFDALRLYQEGIKNVVASSSTAFKPAMARILARYANRVYIAYDGDRAGIEATEKVFAMLLNNGIQPFCVRLPDKEDPDSFIRIHGIAEFQKLMKVARG